MDEREELQKHEDLHTTDDVSDNHEPAILEEVVIEEVGIDGMCGVY